MKKIFFASISAICFICTACNTDSNDGRNAQKNSDEQRNIAASDAIMKAFQTGDVSAIDSVVAEDFIDHTDRGDMKGRDSIKAMVKFVHANFKDMKSEKIREVAEGDFVYSWMRYTGTSDGTMGMPDGPYEMKAIEVARFRDGKAVEHWNFMDVQDMMKMMPAQPGSNAADTSRKK